jgi:hypothetical protein
MSDSVPDGVGISHVSQGETRRIPQGKDCGWRKQTARLHSKEDASSPTITTEAVLLSCIIDAQEERDVAIIDIPNTFIQARVEDEEDMTIIKIRGVLVDIPSSDCSRRLQVLHHD